LNRIFFLNQIYVSELSESQTLELEEPVKVVHHSHPHNVVSEVVEMTEKLRDDWKTETSEDE
jgi:hypothetical protein